jgi:NitT/TauT family transport system substrate-binding protein
VTVQLAWTHSAQFAGFYAAEQRGYYAAEGLAVTLVEGGPTLDRLKPVLEATAQFGIASPDQLIAARAAGQSVRAIATVYRRSPSVYMALADSGITRPQDFVGKTIQTARFGIPTVHAITARVGVRPDQYRWVESTPDLTPFYTGQVHVRGVFLTNEVVEAQAAGYKLNLIYPDDYGIHRYADTIFTSDDVIARNPDLVTRFLRATLKGWTFAMENPTAIGPLVVKYAPQADPALEAAKMTASIPLVNTGEDAIGWMTPKMWAEMERAYREQGLLTAAVDVTQVYTMRFLNEIYGK